MIRSIPGALLAAALCLLQACGGGSSADAGGPAPQPHRLAAALPMPDGAEATVLGKLLLVAAGGEGLQVYDATLPDQPRLLATVKDPSIAGEVARTTAVAASGWRAEVAATTAFLGGPHGVPALDQTEVLLVTADGRVTATPRLQEVAA